jgi:carbon-monoxide dehydrogenase small subunit
MKTHSIKVTINGQTHESEVPARITLIDYLREIVGLTGSHIGCEHGVCGACSILFDGAPMRSCLIFAVQADGHAITTVEGLAEATGELSVLQDSFWETHGLQCGYCTPGMLIAAHALLQDNVDPSDADIRDALGGNLCRCTGYGQIIEAVRLAAARLRQDQGVGDD